MPDIKVPNDLNVTAFGIEEMLLNNPSQNDAIRKALSQSFTLIQGPPGMIITMILYLRTMILYVRTMILFIKSY